MKKGLLVFGLVGLLAASGWAMPTRTAPTTTAGGVFTKITADGPNHQPKISATAWVGVTPFLGPAQRSPSSVPLLSLVISNTLQNGVLYNPTNMVVTNPATMYKLCNGSVSWPNLIISQTNNLWAGRLGPLPPFDQEFGQRMILLVQATSIHGADDISLDMLTFVCASSEGSLNDTYGFTGMNYSSLAIGVKSDGTMITSGSASQKCVAVIVFIYPPVYNGGDTQNGINQVADWFVQHMPFSITNTVQVAGDDSSKSTAVVSSANSGVPQGLVEKLYLNGDLVVANGLGGQVYQLFGSPTPQGAPWLLIGLTTGTNALNVPFTGKMGFFRAQAQ